MANVIETTPGFEEQYVAYERARRHKHHPDHLSPLEIFVLRRVLDSRCLEEHTLRSQIGRSSLSRVVSSLARRNLVRSTVDCRDRRKHVLYPTRPGQRVLAKIDAAHAASLNRSMRMQPTMPAPSSAGHANPEPVSPNSDQLEAQPTTTRRAAGAEDGPVGDDQFAPDPDNSN